MILTAGQRILPLFTSPEDHYFFLFYIPESHHNNTKKLHESESNHFIHFNPSILKGIKIEGESRMKYGIYYGQKLPSCHKTAGLESSSDSGPAYKS